VAAGNAADERPLASVSSEVSGHFVALGKRPALAIAILPETDVGSLSIAEMVVVDMFDHVVYCRELAGAAVPGANVLCRHTGGSAGRGLAAHRGGAWHAILQLDGDLSQKGIGLCRRQGRERWRGKHGVGERPGSRIRLATARQKQILISQGMGLVVDFRLNERLCLASPWKGQGREELTFLRRALWEDAAPAGRTEQV